MATKKTGRQEGLLHSINEEIPLDTYYIDHLDPMQTTQKKYQYIFVVLDAFTKFVALPNKEYGDRRDSQPPNEVSGCFWKS